MSLSTTPPFDSEEKSHGDHSSQSVSFLRHLLRHFDMMRHDINVCLSKAPSEACPIVKKMCLVYNCPRKK